jgi:hypothetical protein
MAAMKIRAIDQKTAHARRAHLAEGDLLLCRRRHGASTGRRSPIFKIADIHQVSSQSFLDKVGN